MKAPDLSYFTNAEAALTAADRTKVPQVRAGPATRGFAPPTLVLGCPAPWITRCPGSPKNDAV